MNIPLETYPDLLWFWHTTHERGGNGNPYCTKWKPHYEKNLFENRKEYLCISVIQFHSGLQKVSNQNISFDIPTIWQQRKSWNQTNTWRSPLYHAYPHPRNTKILNLPHTNQRSTSIARSSQDWKTREKLLLVKEIFYRILSTHSSHGSQQFVSYYTFIVSVEEM